MIKALVIFIFTYLIISGRRLSFIKIGRPAGVMLGTVLMIMAKVMTPEQVYSVINWDTILLLLGMMIVTEHLSESMFFEITAQKVSKKNYSSKKLLAILVFGTGILAAFLVNDIVCIIFTPIVIIMIKKRNLPPLPFIIGLATSTNIGGMMAYTGTPQNMIIGNISGISYSKYFILMFPVGLICLFINYIFLLKLYKKDVEKKLKNIDNNEKIESKPMLKRSITVISLVIISFFIFDNISWVAMAGASFLLLFANRDESDILKKIDWNLLLFFAGLFAVVGGLRISGAIEFFINWFTPFLNSNIISLWSFGSVSVAASNLFANVPYVLVVSESIKKIYEPESIWITLAFASTIAGNLTIIGAVANIIVIERAKDIRKISFMDFFKFGFPTTIICFILGMSIISLYKILGFIK